MVEASITTGSLSHDNLYASCCAEIVLPSSWSGIANVSYVLVGRAGRPAWRLGPEPLGDCWSSLLARMWQLFLFMLPDRTCGKFGREELRCCGRRWVAIGGGGGGGGRWLCCVIWLVVAMQNKRRRTFSPGTGIKQSERRAGVQAVSYHRHRGQETVQTS
jgi:hypothetical protein